MNNKNFDPYKYILEDFNNKINNNIPPIKNIYSNDDNKFIDDFFNIKKKIKELEIIKNFILSILESSRF